ncbi:MAG: hypothetical protein M1831_006809 [Alyxoria varia]|nr:MAG: hypothetical protein M1831_006809 [Alyxoria varia]
MPRGTIDWKSPESYSRLLAAMVAAQDMKLNYKKIADMFGEGATYDAIEGRFRIIKREAQKLKGEIDEGRRELAPNRGGKAQVTPRKPRTPQTNRVLDHDAVLDGRVTKSTNSTPSKKSSWRNKNEILENSTSNSTVSTNGTNSSHEDMMMHPFMANADSSCFDNSFVNAPFDPHAATNSFHMTGNEPVFDNWLEEDEDLA